MSKTSKVKSDLDDITSLVEIIQILKDVASNQFYSAAKRKEKFEEFALAFTEFFRMVSLSEAKSPLIQPSNDDVAVLAITWEGGFMADMNGKVIRGAYKEGEKHNTKLFLVLGEKGGHKMNQLTNKEVIVFTDLTAKGMFKVAVEVKDFIIKQVIEGKIGRVMCVYPRAKNINLIKPAVVKLLPSEELVSKQTEIKDTIEKVIVESDPNDIIHYLADIWLTCRVDEMIEDCVIASFAAQTQQLEASLERLKKEKKGLTIAFKKAKKSDIDKSLREVFTSKLMSGGGKRR